MGNKFMEIFTFPTNFILASKYYIKIHLAWIHFFNYVLKGRTINFTFLHTQYYAGEKDAYGGF